MGTGPEEDDVWRAEPVKRYSTMRPFLPLLGEVIALASSSLGSASSTPSRGCPRWSAGSRPCRGGGPRAPVRVWRRLVFENLDLEPGVVAHRAYAFYVLEQLRTAPSAGRMFLASSRRGGQIKPT